MTVRNLCYYCRLDLDEDYGDDARRSYSRQVFKNAVQSNLQTRGLRNDPAIQYIFTRGIPQETLSLTTFLDTVLVSRAPLDLYTDIMLQYGLAASLKPFARHVLPSF